MGASPPLSSAPGDEGEQGGCSSHFHSCMMGWSNLFKEVSRNKKCYLVGVKLRLPLVRS